MGHSNLDNKGIVCLWASVVSQTKQQCEQRKNRVWEVVKVERERAKPAGQMIRKKRKYMNFAFQCLVVLSDSI